MDTKSPVVFVRSVSIPREVLISEGLGARFGVKKLAISTRFVSVVRFKINRANYRTSICS